MLREREREREWKSWRVILLQRHSIVSRILDLKWSKRHLESIGKHNVFHVQVFARRESQWFLGSTSTNWNLHFLGSSLQTCLLLSSLFLPFSFEWQIVSFFSWLILWCVLKIFEINIFFWFWSWFDRLGETNERTERIWEKGRYNYF